MVAKAAIVATLVVALVAIIVAAATTINSPQGTLFKGSVLTITWSGAPSGTGILGYCSASNTNSCKDIDDNVDLSKNSYAWTIDASPGQYILFINDGTGNKYSGTFTVIDRSSSGGSSPTASGSSSNSTASASPTDSSGATGTTGGAPATTVGNTGSTTTPTGSSSGGTPAPNKSGASTLRSSLLGLFVGLGVVASVMIQLF